MNAIVQVLSVAGAGLILLAFFGLQRRWWPSTHAGYLWFNLIGSLILAFVAIWDRRIGFVLLETAWAGVSAWSIVRRPSPSAG